MLTFLAFFLALISNGVVCHDKAATRPPVVRVVLHEQHFEDGSMRPIGVHLFAAECES